MRKSDRKRHPNGRFAPEQDPEAQRVQEFLELAMKRFRIAEQAEASWRREALDDFNFYNGKQWPDDIKARRGIEQRPCLTINRLKPAKRIITNEMRQQRPGIQVNPEGDGATVETAEIQQGIIRHVEVRSESETHVDCAFDHMVICGLGVVELRTEYRSEKSLKQEIKIGSARNPFMHYFDPSAELPDKSDGKWHFKVKDYTREEFEDRWPDKSASTSLEAMQSVGDNAKDWLQKDSIRVAEYWYADEKDITLFELDSGEVIDDDDLDDETDTTDLPTRKGTKTVWQWAMITAMEILEERPTVWDSNPNVPVLGEDLDINGERALCGMVRDAKDPQRQFNYWETAATESIALAPKAPFVAYAKVIENHEAQWQAANRNNDAVLIGEAVVEGGQLLPLPTRMAAEPPIQALVAMRQSSAANIEAVTGLNDANMGRMKPDESGKAVLARQKQGDVTNLNYSDNLSRALRRIGRMILKAVPKVYDTPQIMRIINPDGSADHVITHVGEDQKDDAMALLQKNPAIKKVIDLSVGSYDTTVSVGPSYQTKRQEEVASIMALIQAEPQVLSLCGDLLVSAMDWNGAPELAKRFKMWVMQQNPWLQDDDKDSPEAKAQKAMAQLAAMQHVHGQVVQALQDAQNIIAAKTVEQQGKQSIEKMRIDADLLMAKWRALTPILVAEINTNAQDAAIRQQIDADVATELHKTAHDLAMTQVVPAAQVAAQQASQQQAAQAQQAEPQPQGA